MYDGQGTLQPGVAARWDISPRQARLHVPPAFRCAVVGRQPGDRRRFRLRVAPADGSPDGRAIRQHPLHAEERARRQHGRSSARATGRPRARPADAGAHPGASGGLPAGTADPFHRPAAAPPEPGAVGRDLHPCRSPRRQRRLRAEGLRAQRPAGAGQEPLLPRRRAGEARRRDHPTHGRPFRRSAPLHGGRDRLLSRRADRPDPLRSRASGTESSRSPPTTAAISGPSTRATRPSTTHGFAMRWRW